MNEPSAETVMVPKIHIPMMSDERWQELAREKKRKTLTLTNSEWGSLSTFLSMTAGYRKEEKGKWEKLSKELDKKGENLYKNAAGNADFWKRMGETIGRIQKAIDGLI